jgi:hypothetical protein
MSDIGLASVAQSRQRERDTQPARRAGSGRECPGEFRVGETSVFHNLWRSAQALRDPRDQNRRSGWRQDVSVDQRGDWRSLIGGPGDRTRRERLNESCGGTGLSTGFPQLQLAVTVPTSLHYDSVRRLASPPSQVAATAVPWIIDTRNSSPPRRPPSQEPPGEPHLGRVR